MATVYLSLGSNLGDRAQNICVGLERLKDCIRLDQVSSLYETEPVGLLDQGWFLNLVCGGETDCSPVALLRLAKAIERELGRKVGLRFGPRPIDIDILFYDDLIMNTPELQVPHPRLHKRGFTLIPLDEVAPSILHPLLRKTIRELRDNATSLEQVRLYTIKDRRASD